MRTNLLLAVVWLLSLGASSCLLKGNKDNLREALLSYNAGLRWGHVARMAEHVPQNKRAALIARRDEFGDLRVTACEVGSVKMSSKEHAVAVVRVNWYLITSVKLRTSIVEQTWKYTGNAWQVVKQRLVRGAPCPLLPQTPGFKRHQRGVSVSLGEMGRPIESK